MSDDATASDDDDISLKVEESKPKPVANVAKGTKLTRCSMCKQIGHNMRTCPQRKRKGECLLQYFRNGSGYHFDAAFIK